MDLSLWNNHKPVCPYCGHEQNDAWEINFGDSAEGSAEINCSKCDEEFFVERSIEVAYTTAPISKEPTP